MKVAVTYDNGSVFQHFGKTAQFLLADVNAGEVTNEQLCAAGGVGHGALAVLLKEWGVETLICGGIGQGAVNALQEAGIAVVRGVDMDARMALQAFAAGALADDPSKRCTHHDHDGTHTCAHHS